jgi:hypothetical protein
VEMDAKFYPLLPEKDTIMLIQVKLIWYSLIKINVLVYNRTPQETFLSLAGVFHVIHNNSIRKIFTIPSGNFRKRANYGSTGLAGS